MDQFLGSIPIGANVNASCGCHITVGVQSSIGTNDPQAMSEYAHKLFHNGTWCQWRETLLRMPKHRIPDGLLSDARVAASMVDLCGTDVLDRLPGRWVFFERDFTELYDDWREWRGNGGCSFRRRIPLIDRYD